MRRAAAVQLLLLALAAGSLVPACQAIALEGGANPIRKVVTMLQSMQKKVEEEGKTEKDLYDKFMCYCSSGRGDLGKSVEAAEDKIPALESDIKAAEGKIEQSKEDLRQAEADKSSAEKAMQEGKAIREKEAAAYAKYVASTKPSVKAVHAAEESLEEGMSSSAFVQTDSGKALQKFMQSADAEVISDEDKEDITAFLSGTEGSDYSPQSGGIVGMLHTMGASMEKGLDDSKKTEDEAIASYQELIQAKTKELKALADTIESKMEDIGELGVSIVQMKEDLVDTKAGLVADKKFVSELQKSCSTKTAEWEQRQKTRAEELVALADTIKVLNDDDALDLFKKTLPSASASLLQMKVTYKAMRSRAMHAIRRARSVALKQNKPSLDFIALALSGKKSLSQGGFDKVVKMCDEMIEVLHNEQLDDDEKKEYCAKQLDIAEDKKKGLDRTVEQEHNALETTKENLATTIDEIAALQTGIKKLDKSVAEATEQRKKENVEYKELMQSNGAAKEVMGFAKNRLNKFYNPSKYEKESGAALLQVPFSLVQLSAWKDAPGPPPETWDAYTKKSSESNGVISMIDLLLKDIEKEMTEAKTEEKDAQSDYETMMKESAEKRTTDTNTLTEKGSAKADMETEIEEHHASKFDAQKEAMATAGFISQLHGECDWLVQYHGVRKEAREGETDAMKKAKAVLNGADYSLVQTRSHTFLHRGAKIA